jgi:hypothetical protein
VTGLVSLRGHSRKARMETSKADRLSNSFRLFDTFIT